MEKAREFFRRNPMLVALIGFLLFYATSFIPSPATDEWKKPVTEILRFALAFGFIALFIGLDRIPLSTKGMKTGFRIFGYYLILIYAATIASVAGKFIKGTSQLTVSGFVAMLVLAVLVGPFEELTCRFLVFGGLSKAWGKTKSGVMWAAVVSSFLFGIAHVLTPILTGTAVTASNALDCVMKTLSAGVIGFVFAAIYVETGNIWVPALLHSLFDFIGFIASASSGNTGELGNYVNISGNISATLSPEVMSIATAVLQAVVILVAIPMIVKAVRILKNVETPFSVL